MFSWLKFIQKNIALPIYKNVSNLYEDKVCFINRADYYCWYVYIKMIILSYFNTIFIDYQKFFFHFVYRKALNHLKNRTGIEKKLCNNFWKLILTQQCMTSRGIRRRKSVGCQQMPLSPLARSNNMPCDKVGWYNTYKTNNTCQLIFNLFQNGICLLSHTKNMLSYIRFWNTLLMVLDCSHTFFTFWKQ